MSYFNKLFILIGLILLFTLTFASETIILPDEDTSPSFGWFGYDVDFDDNNLIVSAIADEYGGSVFTFEDNNGEWEHTQRLTDNGEIGSEFGQKVNIWGDYLHISSARDSEILNLAGSAYIFHKEDGEWNFQQKIVLEDGQEWDYFGMGDIYGEWALFNSYDDTNGENSGAVYAYHLEDYEWVQTQTIYPHNPAQYQYFGTSISIWEEYAIIGSQGYNSFTGASYIFKLENGFWVEKAFITASDGEDNDAFGYRVSIHEDYAIIGADCNDEIAWGMGAAYIFKRENENWIEMAKLLPTIDDTTEFAAFFGSDVDIENNYVVVGQYSYGGGSGFGKASVFRREGEEWSLQKTYEPSDNHQGNHFGYSVAMHKNKILVGARTANSNGSAYIFDEFSSPEIISPIGDIEVDSNSLPFVIADLDTVFADPDSTELEYSVSCGGIEVELSFENTHLVLNCVSEGISEFAVEVTANDGEFETTDNFNVYYQTLSNTDNANVPYDFSLRPAFPNPFNPSTRISFDLTVMVAKNTKIEIYNLKGQKVKTFKCINSDSGKASNSLSHYSVIWNGTNDYDQSVSSGVYFYRLQIGEKTVASKKCLLLK